MAIDAVVLNNDHPDYQHYVDTDPKLAEFVGEADGKNGCEWNVQASTVVAASEPHVLRETSIFNCSERCLSLTPCVIPVHPGW